MKIAGIILILLSLAGFVFGGFSFTTKEKLVDAGPIQIDKENEHSFPITPYAAGAALLAGLVLVVVGSRKS